MKKILIITLLILTSCNFNDYKIEKKDISGTYYFEDLYLTFENNKITGYSKCNDLYGKYKAKNDSISIKIGGTKVFCDETDRNILNDAKTFQITEKELILYASDYEIVLIKEIY